MPPKYDRDMGSLKRGRSKGGGDRSNDSLESDDDDYRKKRDRNNQAVKRSRVKSKMKTQETLERVTQLRNENSALEEKVNTLTKELGFLKELFLAHASNSGSMKLEGMDLQKLLADDSEATTSKSEM